MPVWPQYFLCKYFTSMTRMAEYERPNEYGLSYSL